MFSFSEKRAVGLIQKSFSEFREYNHSCLSRVYPAGIRVTSSNFNPLPHWLVGSQIVALNYQTYGMITKVQFLLRASCDMNGRQKHASEPGLFRSQWSMRVHSETPFHSRRLSNHIPFTRASQHQSHLRSTAPQSPREHFQYGD